MKIWKIEAFLWIVLRLHSISYQFINIFQVSYQLPNVSCFISSPHKILWSQFNFQSPIILFLALSFDLFKSFSMYFYQYSNPFSYSKKNPENLSRSEDFVHFYKQNDNFLQIWPYLLVSNLYLSFSYLSVLITYSEMYQHFLCFLIFVSKLAILIDLHQIIA